MPDAAATLVEELQPYQLKERAAQHPLWWLHELSNIDKHRALHVAASAVVDNQVEIRRLKHAEIVSFEVASGPLHNRTEVGWLRAKRTTEPGVGPDPDMEFNVRFQVDQVFGDATPVPGMPIYDALSEIYAYIRNEMWVARFANYFGV